MIRNCEGEPFVRCSWLKFRGLCEHTPNDEVMQVDAIVRQAWEKNFYGE